jgi:hypothetical protein
MMSMEHRELAAIKRRERCNETLRILVSTLLLLLPMSVRAQQSIAAWETEGKAQEKETGIPRLRLPDNIPPQDNPSKDLVHCSVGLAGRSGYVSIWLKKPDCDAWLQAATAYNKKYGQELERIVARQRAEQSNAEEARRQQQAGPGRMIIYALFLCIPSTGTCQMQGAARVTVLGIMPDMTFHSLGECEQYAKSASGLITPPTGGRYVLPGGMWYECRGRHVDTWEPTR